MTRARARAISRNAHSIYAPGAERTGRFVYQPKIDRMTISTARLIKNCFAMSFIEVPSMDGPLKFPANS